MTEQDTRPVEADEDRFISPEEAARREQQTVLHETRAADVPAQRETRSLVHGEIRAVEGKDNQFVARVCNYGVPDTYRTSWKPGVFTRSLQQKLPKAVWSHDWNRPIGKVISFEDGPEGLDVTVQLADGDAVPDARMARSLLADGVIDQFSFGFVRVADEPDPDHRGVTRITDVELDEISPVLVGSVPGTRTLAVRSDAPIEARTAADIITRFGAGHLDLADALTEIKGAGVQPTDARSSRSAGQRAMTRTPHSYVATNGDGSVCATCGGQSDYKAHQRAQTAGEIRDLAIVMTSDTSLDDTTAQPADLVAATDAAIDAAIALASYQDLTQLPWWVAQMLALIMSADCSIDAAMVALGVPDPDEQVTDGYVRSAMAGHGQTAPAQRTVSEEDTEVRDALSRLAEIR